MLIAASNTYPVKSTGGSATHTQTVEEIASHDHKMIQTGNKSTHSAPTMGRDGSYVDSDNYLSFGNAVQLFDDYKVSIGTTGEGKPMNILNPYYAVYTWLRTA